MSKGNKGFGSMFTEGLDDEENLDKATPADGIMASRSQTLARIALGSLRRHRAAGGGIASEIAGPTGCDDRARLEIAQRVSHFTQ